MDILLFVLYFLSLIFLFRYIVMDVSFGWNIRSVFLIFFLIQYLLVPLLFILNENILFLSFSPPDLKVTSHGLEHFYSFESFALVAIFISFFFVGTWSVNEHVAHSYQLKERSIRLFSREVNLLFLMGLFLALLSLVSLFLYASSFGGIERAVEVAARVRSGYGSEVWLNSRFIFMKRLIPFSMLGIVIFFLLERREGFWVWVLFYLSLGVTLFSKFVLFKGKQGILALILLYLFYLSLKNKKSYFLHFGIFFVAAIFLLPALDIYLDTKKFELPEVSNLLQQLLSMFTFLNFDQVSLEFALRKSYDFAYFQDFIWGLGGSYLPQSWLSSFSSVIYQNTYFFYGYEHLTVPPGVVGFGYYNLGVFGVVLMGFFSGFLVKKIDLFFVNLLHYNPRLIMAYAFVMTQTFTWVRTGIPKYAFYNTSMTVLFLVILWGYSRESVEVDAHA